MSRDAAAYDAAVIPIWAFLAVAVPLVLTPGASTSRSIRSGPRRPIPRSWSESRDVCTATAGSATTSWSGRRGGCRSTSSCSSACCRATSARTSSRRCSTSSVIAARPMDGRACSIPIGSASVTASFSACSWPPRRRSPGVESVTVTRLNRLYEPPNGEIEAGVLPLGPARNRARRQRPGRSRERTTAAGLARWTVSACCCCGGPSIDPAGCGCCDGVTAITPLPTANRPASAGALVSRRHALGLLRNDESAALEP